MDGTAIIVAAGAGERLEAGAPKAFVELAGQPLV
ncbi:MAG: 2-C-methyl-D-erythritol 4-phosphate cytidylyltransferase, partial [Actinomycetota bacterium]|nr:2-C-methyl-D-erythritol 4-phosphate cytidylyltransferase [Actinomycetota bacterium]